MGTRALVRAQGPRPGTDRRLAARSIGTSTRNARAADTFRAAVRPLQDLLVVDLTRYLPGPFASRELQGLGARVVRLLPPDGDPMERLAPAWHRALNDGKETVVIDLKADPEAGRDLCSEADVVLESFRPGVVDRLGVGPSALPDSIVYCSFTGFGRDESRAGHDLNYQGYAGLLADTAPAMPPTQIADLAGGALAAVTRILAALLERARTGRGAHIVVSLTHGAHRLVSHRLDGERIPRLLTEGSPATGSTRRPTRGT